MSRIIKFRAWNLDYEVMEYFDLEEDYDFDHYRKINKGKFKLMQYTGMVDKNGKEIYEGDILCKSYEHMIKSSVDCTGLDHELGFLHQIVEYEDGAFTAINPAGGYEYGRDPETIVIIGNIWENPELLGRKNK